MKCGNATHNPSQAFSVYFTCTIVLSQQPHAVGLLLFLLTDGETEALEVSFVKSTLDRAKNLNPTL